MTQPFHELRERLLRAGVAPRHVRRYLAELTDHLADLTAEEERAGLSPAAAESAALLRLGAIDDLAHAMIHQRRLQSWCVRAPWAIFGLAPISLLAAAYFLALAILWSGWKIFLPGAATPFVRIQGLAIVYFGLGRFIYFGAPVLINWGLACIAARQRFNAVWLMLGSVLIAGISASIQVHASPSSAANGSGHVSLGLMLGASFQDVSYGLLHALALLALSMLPYLVWRRTKVHAQGYE